MLSRRARHSAQPLDLMKNAPADYQCPFCHLAETLPTPRPEIILVEPRIFAFIPLHHYGGIRGNCLVAPRVHYENDGLNGGVSALYGTEERLEVAGRLRASLVKGGSHK